MLVEQRGRSPVEFVGASVDVGEFFRDAAQLREVGPSSIPRPLRIASAVPCPVHHRDRRRRSRRRRRRPGRRGRCRCAPRSPARMSRTRRDNECGVSGCDGKGRAPHWSIGGNSGTTAVAASSSRLDRHRCGDSPVTASALPTASATIPVLILVTARSTTRSQRVTAQHPHTTGSSSGSDRPSAGRSRSPSRCRRRR